MSSKKPPLGRAKADEVNWNGRAAGALPGLRAYTMDANVQLYFSTAMSWGSLATKTTKIGPLPFDFNIVDIFTVLKTAPVSTGNKKFRIGTTTDDDLFFSTMAFKFTSGDSTTSGVVRRTTASNFILATGRAGQIVQFKLPPTAAVVSNGGSVFGVLAIVPRNGV